MKNNELPRAAIAQDAMTSEASPAEIPLGGVRRNCNRPRRYTKVVSIYVTPAEHQDIATRAAAQNDSVSRFVRKRVLRRHSDLHAGSAQLLQRVNLAFAAMRQSLLDAPPESSLAKNLEVVIIHLSALRNILRGVAVKHDAGHKGK